MMTIPFITPSLTQTDHSMKQLITIVCILLTLSVSAQDRRPNPSGQFSPAEYAKQQREFFTRNAELTQEEADAFFPIYNELQQKKREINRQIRMIMRHEGDTLISEEQSLKAIEAKADANIRIAELEKEYLKKFKEVLPASKILKVQNAEEQFNSQILKDIQQSRGHQFQQGPQGPQRPGRPGPTSRVNEKKE